MPDGEYPQSRLRREELEERMVTHYVGDNCPGGHREESIDPKAEARINSPYTIYYIYPGVDEARVTRELRERNLKGLVTHVHYHKDWELCNARCQKVRL